jgi:hypothetical protein
MSAPHRPEGEWDLSEGLGPLDDLEPERPQTEELEFDRTPEAKKERARQQGRRT